MYTEKTTIDLIEIRDFNFLHVRRKTEIFRNEELLTTSYSSRTYLKDKEQELFALEDDRVKAIAKILWENLDTNAGSTNLSSSTGL